MKENWKHDKESSTKIQRLLSQKSLLYEECNGHMLSVEPNQPVTIMHSLLVFHVAQRSHRGVGISPHMCFHFFYMFQKMLRTLKFSDV